MEFKTRDESEIDLAKMLLNLLVFDLEYSSYFTAAYGHCPIRHMLAWSRAEEILGEDFESEVKNREQQLGEGTNFPVKTCPTREKYRSREE